jgi:hypothetical protein
MIKSVSAKTDAPVVSVQQSVNEKFILLISLVQRLQKSLLNTLRTIHEKEKEQDHENLELKKRHLMEERTLEQFIEQKLEK